MAGFFLVTLISIAFAAALILRPETLTNVWQSVRGLPLIVQLVVWVLFLPWMLSLWVWRASWPLWARVILVAALVIGTPLAFFPRQK